MLKSAAETLSTTRKIVVPAHPANRFVHIHAKGQVFIGGSDVTAANGYHMDNGDKLDFELPAEEDLYAIALAGTPELTLIYDI